MARQGGTAQAEPGVKGEDLAPGTDPFEGLDLIKFSDCQPYEGSDKLPEPVVKTHERVTDKGQRDVKNLVRRAGRPRFRLERSQSGRVLVIGVWRDVNGVSSRSLTTLKPDARVADRKLYDSLRQRGFPESFAKSYS